MKKGLIIGAVVIAFIGAGAVYGIMVNQGKHDTELAIIGPGQAVSFTLDAGQPIEVTDKGRKIVKVQPGKHTLKFSAPEVFEQTVEVAEFKRVIVPVIKDQCFAKLDVSLSHYGRRHEKLPPSLRELKRASAPFELSKSHYLHPNELPDSNTEGQPVWLYRSASCESLVKMEAAQRERNAKLLHK